MLISVRSNLHYIAARPCDLLLQIEAVADPSQKCVASALTFAPDQPSRVVASEDGAGTRRWLTVGSEFVCRFEATFDVDRADPDIGRLSGSPVSATPDSCTTYLLPSRYCHPEAFFDVVGQQFGGLSGGALVAGISRWIHENFTYEITASHASTTATDSYHARAGVCRDYAHVLIAMVRAAGIPARYVSAYAPDVSPQDFHAVAEVYLEGEWHMIDPTGMARPDTIVRIGVGRDAADVSFLTSYGFMTLKSQSVEVWRGAAP